MKRALRPEMVAAALLMFAAAPAMAQRSGGDDATVIRGNTNIDVVATDTNTVAAGIGNTAKTNIGSVCGNKTGNTNITVDVKNVENINTGIGRKSTVNVGSSGC